MTFPNLNDLVVYSGNVNNMEARVRAWLPGADDGDWQLAGHVLGPRCDFARTLPATISLRPTQTSSGLQSVAVVPDPCLWTPDLPMLYEVRVELRRGDEVVATVERPLAIRMFGPRGRDLNFSGRRWVLRGVRRDTAPDAPITAWREAGAAMLVEVLDDDLAAEAARIGIPLVVSIRETTPEGVTAELRRLARLPAVIMAAIDATAALPDDIGVAAIDIRLAAHCQAENSPPALPRWANVLLCESEDAAAMVDAVADRDIPVIAFRPAGQLMEIAKARAACDALQRDLAPQADLAGYIV